LKNPTEFAFRGLTGGEGKKKKARENKGGRKNFRREDVRTRARLYREGLLPGRYEKEVFLGGFVVP